MSTIGLMLLLLVAVLQTINVKAAAARAEEEHDIEKRIWPPGDRWIDPLPWERPVLYAARSTYEDEERSERGIYPPPDNWGNRPWLGVRARKDQERSVRGLFSWVDTINDDLENLKNNAIEKIDETADYIKKTWNDATDKVDRRDTSVTDKRGVASDFLTKVRTKLGEVADTVIDWTVKTENDIRAAWEKFKNKHGLRDVADKEKRVFIDRYRPVRPPRPYF